MIHTPLSLSERHIIPAVFVAAGSEAVRSKRQFCSNDVDERASSAVNNMDMYGDTEEGYPSTLLEVSRKTYKTPYYAITSWLITLTPTSN